MKYNFLCIWFFLRLNIEWLWRQRFAKFSCKINASSQEMTKSAQKKAFASCLKAKLCRKKTDTHSSNLRSPLVGQYFTKTALKTASEIEAELSPNFRLAPNSSQGGNSEIRTQFPNVSHRWRRTAGGTPAIGDRRIKELSTSRHTPIRFRFPFRLEGRSNWEDHLAERRSTGTQLFIFVQTEDLRWARFTPLVKKAVDDFFCIRNCFQFVWCDLCLGRILILKCQYIRARIILQASRREKKIDNFSFSSDAAVHAKQENRAALFSAYLLHHAAVNLWLTTISMSMPPQIVDHLKWI